MNEQLDANSVIEEYRGIVANLVHQAAVSGALITKLRADIEALKKDGDHGSVSGNSGDGTRDPA